MCAVPLTKYGRAQVAAVVPLAAVVTLAALVILVADTVLIACELSCNCIGTNAGMNAFSDASCQAVVALTDGSMHLVDRDT